jgi:hypothetical protein
MPIAPATSAIVVLSGSTQPICADVAVVHEIIPGPLIVSVDPSPWTAPRPDAEATASVTAPVLEIVAPPDIGCGVATFPALPISRSPLEMALLDGLISLWMQLSIEAFGVTVTDDNLRRLRRDLPRMAAAMRAANAPPEGSG